MAKITIEAEKKCVLVFDVKGTLTTNTDSLCIRANTKYLLDAYRKSGYRIYAASSEQGILGWRCPRTLMQLNWIDDAIFTPKGERGDGDGKFYRNIAKAEGLTDEEAARFMFIAGSSIWDRPCDLHNVVTLVHPDGYLHDALVHREIVLRLQQESPGNFLLGFERLMQRGQKLVLNPKVSILLYRTDFGPPGSGSTTPIIEVYAPGRKRNLNNLPKLVKSG